MNRRQWLPGLVLIVLLVAGTALGQTWPVAANCSVAFNSSSPAVSILVLPNGTGTPLSSCWGQGGVLTSATITVTLIDATGLPVINFPQTDIRLEEQNSTMAWCSNSFYPPPAHAPNCADGPTNIAGQTTFTLAYHGGGWQSQNCRVWVLEANGQWQPIPGVLPVSMNSPDLTGDLVINLSDIVLFTQDIFSGSAPYRSDFNWDGIINLSDYPVFAQAIGMTCP